MNFLPKTLNKTENSPLCIDIQKGALITDMHWHDCVEIIHLKKGTAGIFTKNGWTQIYEGETAFIPKGEAHCCHCADKNALRIVIGLTEELIGGKGLNHNYMLFPFNPNNTNRRIFEKSDELTELFTNLQTTKGGSISQELNKQLNVCMIYSKMLEFFEKDGIFETSKLKSEVVKKIEKIINEKYYECITAQQVAKEVNLSYSHMAKLLRDECGMSFNEIVLSHRIDAAKKLILTTDISITDIGLSVGFSDTSYFIKRFSQRVGQTPYKYRKHNLSILNK